MDYSVMLQKTFDDADIFSDTMVNLSWPEVQSSSDRGDIVLLPIGIIEAHGPHMDLSPDIQLAHLYCRFLRKELSARCGIDSIIAPPVYWGHAADTARYAGTFSVRPETMKALLSDIYTSLDSWGFKHVFIVNCHGDHAHTAVIDESIRVSDTALQIKIVNLGNLDVSVDNPPLFPPARAGRFEPDYHAGAVETAQMGRFFPRRVNLERAKTLPPSDCFHPSAYCGDPASYSLETEIEAFYKADLEMDAKKIAAFLKS